MIKITTGEELRLWIEQNDLLLTLSDKECQQLLRVLEDDHCQLYYDHQELRISRNQLPQEKITIDDVIDLACESVYEKRMQMENNIRHKKNNQMNALSEYTDLKNKERELLVMFNQTIYGQRFLMKTEKIRVNNCKQSLQKRV